MGRKALIVCGPVVKKIGIAGKVAAVLEKYDISYVIFAGITDEPTDQMVEEGTKIYLEQNCDFLIGAGGGSLWMR